MRTLVLSALALAACSNQPKLKPPPASPLGSDEPVPTVFVPLPVDTGSPAPNLFRVWGRAADDLWVVGEQLYAAHYDGKNFTRAEIPVAAALDPAHGCQACGTGGTGPSKTCVDVPPLDDGTGLGSAGGAGGSGIAGSGGMGGEGGAGGSSEPPTPDLRGLAGRALPQPPPKMGETPPPPKSELFAAGTEGTVLHFDGDTWTVEPVVLVDPANPKHAVREVTDLNAVDSSGGNNAVVVGNSGLLAVRNPAMCRFEITTAATQENLNAVRMEGNEVVAVGNLGALVAGSGTTYQKVPQAGLTVALRAIWGVGSSNFYVAGLDGTLLRGSGSFPDGLTLTEITGAPKTYLRDIWGTGMNDVFLAGWSGTLIHYDGKKVQLLADTDGNPFTDQRLEGVWGFPRDPKVDGPAPKKAVLTTNAVNVFVVGVTGTFLRGP